MHQHASCPSDKDRVCTRRCRVDGDVSCMPPARSRHMLSHLIGMRCVLKKEGCPGPFYSVDHLLEAESKWRLRTTVGHITTLRTRPCSSPTPTSHKTHDPVNNVRSSKCVFVFVKMCTCLRGSPSYSCFLMNKYQQPQSQLI